MSLDARRVYLHLLKRALTRLSIHPAELRAFAELGDADFDQHLYYSLVRTGYIKKSVPDDPHNTFARLMGLDWPAEGEGETMVGLFRLDNVERCCTQALEAGVPGDFVETGVWRGGCSILMAGVLRAFGIEDRQVWVCDSFQGLPVPDPKTYPADQRMNLHKFNDLAVSQEQVAANFGTYGLLDDRVKFLPGWFRDTLPTAPIERIAVLRLDGDLYESTIVALRSLYHKVSPGGYVIVDDYEIKCCQEAITDFFDEQGLTEPLFPIDWSSVYWQKGYVDKQMGGAP